MTQGLKRESKKMSAVHGSGRASELAPASRKVLTKIIVVDGGVSLVILCIFWEPGKAMWHGPVAGS